MKCSLEGSIGFLLLYVSVNRVFIKAYSELITLYCIQSLLSYLGITNPKNYSYTVFVEYDSTMYIKYPFKIS